MSRNGYGLPYRLIHRNIAISDLSLDTSIDDAVQEREVIDGQSIVIHSPHDNVGDGHTIVRESSDRASGGDNGKMLVLATR